MVKPDFDFPADLIRALDRRPAIVVLAGPNGAGKSSFHQAFLVPTGLRYLNADDISREMAITAYEAAAVASRIRHELVLQRESFIFETVFSDPVGDKLGFLKSAAEAGYNVVLCFIGLSRSERCEQRVAMRVAQGGHDVASDKLISRFPRTMANLNAAIHELPFVLVFDNDDLLKPFRKVAVFIHERMMWKSGQLPGWLGKFCG